MDQAGTLRKLQAVGKDGGTLKQKLKAIAVASGKGGVGKTNIVANLAFELTKRGKKVLVFDADMGLGNIHILLGLAPKYNVGHVLTGAKKLKEILVEGPGGIMILPASTGNKKYSEITREEKLVLKTELEIMQDDFDYILFDIGAGISANVMFFCSAAKDIMVVASPEPTSFSDAYAIMKVLSRDYLIKEFRLIVNSCKDFKEAQVVYKRLVMVSDRFGLGVKIDLLGHLVFDTSVTQAVRKQKLFCELYPSAPISRCLSNVADTLEKVVEDSDVKWGAIFGEKVR